MTLQNYEELRLSPNIWDKLHDSVTNRLVVTLFCHLDSVSDSFHGGFVIVYLNRFERAFQFVHQFWIEFAHAEGEFHADGLNAREFLNIHHVLRLH